MRKFELTIPDSVDISEFDFYLIIASNLYADAKLSAVQAAELVGLSKRSFIEIMGKCGVSVFSSSVTDLHSDISNA